MTRRTPRGGRRRGIGVIALALTSAAAGSFILSTGLAGATGSGVPGEERVIVCESGVVDHGNGVETSSSIAAFVSDEAGVPEGCRDG